MAADRPPKSRVDEDVFRLLAEAVGEEHLSRDPVDLVCHSYDASRTIGKPDVVVKPVSADEVSRIMVLAADAAVPVYPLGAASGLTGGSVPVEGGIVLDLSRMNRIIDIDAVASTATVEPGVIVGDLQRRVEAQGLFYPPDPASADFCTVGGTIAECAGGLRCVKYGVTRDYVLGLEVVLPSGEIIHTGSGTLKNVTGYDLTRLFVGSEGTLGVFTQIILKLVPLPETVQTAAAFFETESNAISAAIAILQARIVPRALEFMDSTVLDSIRRHQGRDLPEGARAALLIEVDGSSADTDAQMSRVLDVLDAQSALRKERVSSQDESDELWSIRRGISPALYKLGDKKLNEDVCVPRSKLLELLEGIDEIRRSRDVTVGCFGHVGDGNIHVNFLMDSTNADECSRAERGVEDLFELVLSLGGTLSGEHGVGTAKSPYLSMEIGDAELKVMRSVKRLFDPKGILNPGKIFT